MADPTPGRGRAVQDRAFLRLPRLPRTRHALLWCQSLCVSPFSPLSFSPHILHRGPSGSSCLPFPCQSCNGGAADHPLASSCDAMARDTKYNRAACSFTWLFCLSTSKTSATSKEGRGGPTEMKTGLFGRSRGPAYSVQPAQKGKREEQPHHVDVAEADRETTRGGLLQRGPAPWASSWSRSANETGRPHNTDTSSEHTQSPPSMQVQLSTSLLPSQQRQSHFLGCRCTARISAAVVASSPGCGGSADLVRGLC